METAASIQEIHAIIHVKLRLIETYNFPHGNCEYVRCDILLCRESRTENEYTLPTPRYQALRFHQPAQRYRPVLGRGDGRQAFPRPELLRLVYSDVAETEQPS